MHPFESASEAGGGPSRPSYFYRQSAAIPVRRVSGPPSDASGAEGRAVAAGTDPGTGCSPDVGSVQVLMVTSRSGKRWVVPKGIVEPGLSPADSAANEAWEEGGVRGSVRPVSIGTYRYDKWGGTCTVKVFVLEVEELEDGWPEQALRERRWFSPADAAELVREPDLAEMIRALG